MSAPYRNDVDALRDRLASLQEQLERVQDQRRALGDLDRAQAELEGEVNAVRRSLEGMSARRSLPLLEGVRVASPCNVDWDSMVGDGRVRYCGECGKDVFNVAEMTRAEAERLVADTTGGVCVRLYRRADGTVITSDCPVGVRKARTRKVAAAAVTGGMLAASALVGQTELPGFARAAHLQPPQIELPAPEREVEMGKMRPMMGVVAVPMRSASPQRR